MYFNKEKNIRKREIEKIEKETGKKVKFEKNKVVKIGREKIILVFFLILFFLCIYFLFSKKIYGVEFFKTLNEEEINRNENIDVKTKGNVFKAQDENVFYEGNIMYKIPSKNIGEEKYSDIFVPVIFSKLDKGLSFSFQENLKSPNENERYVKENTNDPLDALDYDASGELRFVKSIFSKDNSNLNNISREMKNMLNYGFSKMYLTETDENIRREKKTKFFKEIFGEGSDVENKIEDIDVYIASQLYVWNIINKRERNFSKIKREILNQEGEPKTEDISSEKAKAIKKIYEFLIENSNSNKEFNNQYKRPDLAYAGLKNIDEKGLILKDVKLNIPESMTRSLKDFKVLIYSKTKQEYILIPAANIKLIYNENIKEMNLNELSNFSKENDFKTFNIDLLIDRKYLEENFGSNEKLENLDFSRIKLKLEYKYLENIPVVYRPEKEEYKSALNILKNNNEYTKTVDLIYKQNDLRLDLGLLKINNIPVTGRDLNAKNIDVSNLLNLVNPEGKATNFNVNLAKERLEVLPKDKLEFNIKVINEGDNAAYPGDILCYIPQGMDVDLNEEINQKYGWSKISDNIYVSSYLKNKKIEESKKIKKNEETNIMKLDDENIKIKTSINSDNDNLKTLDVFAKLANSYFIKNSDKNLENGEENFGNQLDDVLEGGEKSNSKNNSKDNSNILDDIVEDFKPEENKENSKESEDSKTENSNKDKNQNQKENKKERRKDQNQIENKNKKSEGTTNLDFYLNEDRDSTFLKEDGYVKYFNEKEFLKDIEKMSDDLSKEELIINEKSDLSLKIIPFEKNGEKISDFDSTKNIDTKNLKNIENTDNKEVVDLDAKYNISKNVLDVKEGDVLKFKICVFNEGNVDEVAEKVSVFLPSNLELIENDNTNLKEGWYKDSGCISTEKIKDNLIKKPFKTDKTLNLAKYEIELLVEVKDVKKGKNVNDQNEVFGMLAEIKKQQRIDRDSFANNIDFEKLNEKELNKEIKKHLSKDSEKAAGKDEKYEESKGDINKDTLEYKMIEDDTDYFAFKLLEENRDLALRIKALKIGEGKAPNRNENVLENIDVSQIYDETQNKLKDKEKFEKGNIIYNSPKNPINVNQNERMTFEISMFNEAKEDTKGQKIRVFVPEYLDFLDEEKSAVNKKYGWKRLSTNPKIIETEYLEDKDIKGLKEKTKENKGNKESIISREIVELELISKQMVEDENQVIIAEIAKGKNGDKDSVSGNLNFEYMSQNPKAFLDEYMINLQNLDLSENKYFRCLEDDDDFEIVVYKNKALDLSLKMFTTGINNTKIEEEPLVNVSEVLKNKQSAYKNIKNPKVINQGDLIRNKIRIYNEGEKAGLATGIKIYIPEGMGYVMENKTNIKNLWKIEKANQPEYLSKYTNEKLEDNKKQIFEVDMDDPLIIKGPAVLKRNEIKAVGEKPYDLIPPLSNMKDIYYLDYEFCTVVLEENKDRSNNIEGQDTNEIKAENINFRAEYISEHQSTENAQNKDAQINTNSNQNEVSKEENRDKNKAENKKEEELLVFAEITETFSEDGSLDKDSVADNFSKDTFSFTDKEDDTDFLVFTLKNTKVDLFLKMGVSKIWEEGTKRSLGYSRIDIKEDINLNEKIENNDVDKKPLDISEKDSIEFKIRVYNRGNISAFAKQISIYLPDELEYDTESEINKNTKYRTYTKDGKATREKEEIKMLKTNILSYEELLALGKNNPILPRDRNGNLNYHEITLVLKVKENNIKTNENEEVSEKENKNKKSKENKKAKKYKNKDNNKNNNNNKDEKDLNKIGSFRVYSEIDEVTDIYGNYLKDEKSNYGSFKNENLDGLQVIEDDTDYEVFKKIDFIIRPEINLKGVGLTTRNKKGILEYIKTDVEENKKSINLNLSDIKKAQTMELIYKIDIENIGEIEGNVTELEVDIPENFGLSVKNRAFWSMKSKNKISTTDISKFVLNPGDKKSLNLILDADVNLVDTSSLLASVNIAKTYNEYDIENLNLNSNLNTSKTNIKILDIKNKIYYPLVTVLSLILASLIANTTYIFIKNKKMNKIKNNINII